MLFLCPVSDCDSALHLYSRNGTDKNIEKRIKPTYFGFNSMTIDSKSRIIVTGSWYINVYATSSDSLNYDVYNDFSTIYDCDYWHRTETSTTITETTTTTTETMTIERRQH